MNQFNKSVVSLSTAVILCCALVCSAQAGPARDKSRTQKLIETCIAEINQQADYTGASKVRHWVMSRRQISLVSTTIRVETSVYSRDEDNLIAGYSATCVTGELGELVEFRITQTSSGM